ncbi:DUF3781 domain-containing protein [Porphyromonas sp.]|uniref:DUF3781 domain-containing protein n=1 Tax=Porphyromonas sp. TaxID=1924944 RepID=UPI0026DD7633|nr:DUF3781 domain-containing protein [Porphyromonas sp.]MDO4771388.1 DUF3781 domain-containing protein [Porphyromonas sp.]
MNKAILFIFSGLPAVGKSTLSKFVAKEFRAFYLRIDTIEQGLRDLCRISIEGEGYRLAYRIASDNLQLGNNVVTDSCNPIELTRNEWEEVAAKSDCRFLNVEIICSDKSEHKQRAMQRVSEIANMKIPTWDDIKTREYHKWEKDRIVIDTAGKTIEQCKTELKTKITDSLSLKRGNQAQKTIGNSLKEVILQRLCYTKLVYGRINRKLNLHLSPQEIEDFIACIINRTDETHFLQKGKNYYITNNAEGFRITINSFTYRVITADKI